MNASRQTSYTGPMSIVRNIAAIAKGMSITFGEMLQPTQVENYPDGKGPMRGAEFRAAFSRRPRAAAGRKWAGEVRCLLSVRGRLPGQLHLHRSCREHRGDSASPLRSVTPRSTTSTTTAASSVDIASKPARPTPSPTATAFELASLNATNLVMRKEDMLLPVSAIAAANSGLRRLTAKVSSCDPNAL